MNQVNPEDEATIKDIIESFLFVRNSSNENILF